MSRALEVPPPGLTDLSVEEQIDYVQALWDVIAAHPEAVPVSGRGEKSTTRLIVRRAA
jgi:putative addiction module component (TIGR02574 family)